MAKSIMRENGYRFTTSTRKPNTITCILDCSIDFENYLANINDDDIYDRIIDEIIKIPEIKHFGMYGRPVSFKVIASTTCLEDDEFNKTRGEHIALTKAQRKAFKIARQIAKIYRKEFVDKLVDKINTVIDNEWANEDNATQHLIYDLYN